MLIQIENMRGNASPRGVGTNVPASRGGAILPRNLLSACRAAFRTIYNVRFLDAVGAVLRDVCAVLAAFLLVTATGLGLAFALFVAIFVKL